MDEFRERVGVGSALGSVVAAMAYVGQRLWERTQGQGADPLLVQTQHIGDDGLFALVKDAGFCTLFHQDLDLIVGDRRLLAAFAAQQADQQVA